MKREEKESKEKERNQGDSFFGSESDNCGYGFEHAFFIDNDNKSTEKTARREEPEKHAEKGESTDQSKTFFLPDFFSDED